MNLVPIKRDQDGLAETRFCRETPDGGVNITFRADTLPYQLGRESLANAPSFATAWNHLIQKSWFTTEIAADVVSVVAGRWLARDAGWL